ncbi:alpha-mannosidase [Robinsoniella sp. KNHs210]|uniref:alpha-mannosidase n=1 Tax=Robinsoniella sp. KNHs210 TaxID=1469950 RepID=UPI000483DFF4|nr:glycoside hydrolase family 38 C-terminal domain-containing protein [Robinsoniella sp. KNHs210]
MKKNKKAYVIPHTHWDREWRYPIWKNRMLLMEFMDKLLKVLDQDENYRCFLMDGQVAPIEDYLQVCPQQKEKVSRYISEGRIAIGPWYTLPDLYPVDGECLIRNLLKGIRMSNQYGGCLKVGYNSFGWGQTAQFPQIYAGFGMDFIICAKKVSKDRAPESEFMWESPDGTKVLTSRLGEHARANFYFHTYLKAKYGINCLSKEFCYRADLSGMAIHNAAESSADEDYFVISPKTSYNRDLLSEGMRDAWDATEDTTVKDVRLFLNGTDFSTPHPELSAMLEDLNLFSEDTKFVNDRLEEYVEQVHKCIRKDRLHTVKGELRDGPACDCSGNALASRCYLKQLNKQAQNLILHKAEPYLVFSSLLGGDDLKGYLSCAWEYLLKAHPHDSINGVTQDKTADDVEYRLSQALEMGQTACDKAISHIIKQIDTTGYKEGEQLIAVFNPHPYELSEIVKVCVTSPQEENAWDFIAYDVEGNPLMVQEISRDEKVYPVHDVEARPWPYAADRHMLYLETGIIPAMGYKIIGLRKKQTLQRTHFYWMPMRKSLGKDICSADNILENEYLRISVNENGTFDLVEKEHGKVYKNLHYFEDTGDVGNYWAYYPPYHNKTFTTLTKSADVWLEDNGPLSATIGIGYHLELPRKGYESKCGVRGEGKRSDETQTFDIVSQITLNKGSKRLDIKTSLTNNVENHRLRVAFPTGIDCDHADAQGHFTVDARPVEPIKDEGGMFYPEMQTLPMQNFVDVQDGIEGIAFLNKGLTEYEIKNDGEHTLYLTLFRAMGNMIVTWWEAVGEFPKQKGSQVLRTMEFEYSIYPHQMDFAGGHVYAQAAERNVPVFAYQICGRSNGTLTAEQGFFKLCDKNLVISALKRAEDRDSIILRVFNPTHSIIKSSFQMMVEDVEISELWECSLNEERISRQKVKEGHEADIIVESNKITTWELVMEKSKKAVER